ncbi:MAG: hypothetical protein JXR96_11405 [Deltaproteobacteria bacterium]|nr:hypothetical protein [Deltaproteobacteria bacterium]
MRVLFWYCERLAWRPALKTLPDVPEGRSAELAAVVAAFVHVEPADVERASKVETKLVKNCKWLAGKWDTRQIVLHSFTHLAEEKAEPDFARALMQRARERLIAADYRVAETPYGHFLDLSLSAPGHPLARIFKQL